MTTAAQEAISKWSGIYGVPIWVTDSIATQESNLNPAAVGDQGTSFGIFQLHQGGGQGDGYTPSQLLNPNTNAQIGISAIAPAYQAGVKQGLTGYPLLQYTADHSGHPTETGVLPAAYNKGLASAYQKVTGKKTTVTVPAATSSNSPGGIVGGIKQVAFGLMGGAVAIAGLWVLFKNA